jgi:transposase-like protein
VQLETYEHKNCPQCGAGHTRIEYGQTDTDARKAWQEATCTECGCAFWVMYEYVGTELIPKE